MIGVNGFCLLDGGDAERRLIEASKKVDRFSERVVMRKAQEVFPDVSFRGGQEASIALFVLGDDGRPPLVHGFSYEERRGWEGEFSLLGSEKNSLVCERDFAGTRPLYIREGSELCIASDHRFMLGTGGRLLNPGERFPPRDGRLGAPKSRRPPGPEGLHQAARELAALVEESIRKRLAGRKRVAVSFSGGLDSALIAKCASKFSEVLLCSVFSRGSRDERFASDAAEALDLEYKSEQMTRKKVEEEIAAMDLPFVPSSMDRALWCIYSTAARMAKEKDAELILLGQLADELFGGYKKYSQSLEERGSAEASLLMANDVLACGRVGFLRDEQACARFVEPRFPYADRSIVEFALAAPIEFKIRDGMRKLVLREAATILGLPEELAQSPKKAAQYSSGVLKLVT
ncbi:MAG: asparagine synthase-related protein [Thaumarchaeota archaeon]|nr:asparagine synthase-related protein [Nitrososphaerota archaeon]